jgi:hypothetical protein
VTLEVEAREAGGVALLHGTALVADARSATPSVELPVPVSFDEARESSRHYPGFDHHQYPSCFVCGQARPLRDGLALYPGAVSGRAIVAAPWQPAADLCDEEGRVRTRFMWAALDCPSWYGYAAFHEPVPILLGRLTAHVAAQPRAAEPCVVHGWLLAREGRKIRAASAVFDAQGKPLAWAEAIWIVLKSGPSDFQVGRL